MSKVIPIRPKLSISQKEADQALREIETRCEQREQHQRKPSRETFARFPHAKALALYRDHRLSGTAWALLVEIDYLILKSGGKKSDRTFKLTFTDNRTDASHEATGFTSIRGGGRHFDKTAECRSRSADHAFLVPARLDRGQSANPHVGQSATVPWPKRQPVPILFLSC
jgi:hypothetical protein